MKTSELSGAALDHAVAKCEELAWALYDERLEQEADPGKRPSEHLRDYRPGAEFTPSTDWSQGGPIIEREEMTIEPFGEQWGAGIGDVYTKWYMAGPPPPSSPPCVPMSHRSSEKRCNRDHAFASGRRPRVKFDRRRCARGDAPRRGWRAAAHGGRRVDA